MTSLSERMLDAARRGKHLGLLGRRRLTATSGALRDRGHVALSKRAPYVFDTDRYRDAAGFLPFDFFLHRTSSPFETEPGATTPRTVLACWTGDNPMTRNRIRCWEQFCRANPDVETVLVTSENLHDFIDPEWPLHPAYDSLSSVHKSDYLRAYLMHFHGGGYTDIKEATGRWGRAFSRFDDPDVWVIGYPEPTSMIADNLYGPLRSDLKRHHARLVGNGAFIVRPRTPFTAEWLTEVHRRLDYYSRDLTNSPAIDPYGVEGDYPVTWVGLQGLVFHPLQLKYLDHVRQASELTPSLVDFR